MDSVVLDDETLVDLVKRTKENKYFHEIFVRYKQRVYLLSFKLLRNEALAEELTHDVFIKVFEKIEYYEGGNFYSWLVRVTQNAYIDKVRSFKREAKALEEMRYTENERMATINGQRYSAGEMRILCQDAMKQIAELSAEQKICFLLKYIKGYNYNEIAQRTGYTLKQVRTYLQNGRRNFSLCWEIGKRKRS